MRILCGIVAIILIGTDTFANGCNGDRPRLQWGQTPAVKATRFRQWATRVIKEYLLNGRAVNKDLAEAKKALTEHEKRLSNVELGVETIIHTLMPPIVNRKTIGFNVDR